MLHIIIIYQVLSSQGADLLVEFKISSKAKEKGNPNAQEF